MSPLTPALSPEGRGRNSGLPLPLAGEGWGEGGGAQVLPCSEATVVQMLAAAAQAAPQGEALVFGERRLDYAGYLASVAGFARELQELGAAGGRVATLMGNSIDACIAALAALAAGAQQVPLNPLYTAYELAMIFEDAAPAVLVVDAALVAMAEPVARRAGVSHIIVVGEGARRLDTWRAGEGTLPPVPTVDSLALLQYTGGTTGRPKGVELTHGAIAVNVAQREAILPSRRGDRILCMMPLSHAYAMAMGLFLSLHSAGTLVILPRYQPDDVLDSVSRERIGVFLGSPTIFTGLLAHPGFAATDWRTVHTCYSGSAALPAATLQRWRDEVGAPVYEGYGQTEAGPVLSFNPVRGPVKPGTVGVPVPLTEIEIVDVATGQQVLPAGTCGEIRARGPQVMRGYRNRPEETAQALRGGWLYTGDIGEFDADGYLSIRDRKKDMVIVGGYNVYPREVEDVLFAHPDVADAAVVGRPDDYRGEMLVAHVVPRPGAQPDTDALLAHCRERLARYKLPAEWRFTHALPKTLANKTDKNALRRS
jgi:long-chain acyl-CoA synthetase